MRLFISHSWKDKPLVYDLVDSLNELIPGADIWLDSDDLNPGDRIKDEVEEAMDAADIVVLVWSENAARSDGVDHEVDHLLRTDVTPVVCIAEDDAGPRLPTGFGRLPYVLQLGSDPSEDRRNLVSAGIAQILVERLANDPEVAMGNAPDLLRPLRRFGANLRHLSGSERDESAQSRKRGWIDRLLGDGADLNREAERRMNDLATATGLLDRVVEAVGRAPTDRAELGALRVEAQALASTDPEGSAQAIKVIDLRLADPLR